MGKAVGIDLGTTNSVVSATEGGAARIIASIEGSRTTPSVVAFLEDGERLVGAIAKRQSVMNPEGTVYSSKRFIGRRFDEVKEEIKHVTYKVVPGPNDAVRFDIRGSLHSPEEIAAQIIRKLVADASAFLGEKVTDAVITVPAYFNDAQRHATKDAGKIAGINVIRVVNEPTAAALAYGLEKKTSETVMVFDLGGGTFDVSILEVGDGVVEVKSTSGDTHLGGDDFDKAIVDWMAEEFKKDHGTDLREDPASLQRLIEAAESAKIELSATTQTAIKLPFVKADASGPKHLNMNLARSTFDQLTGELVERTRLPLKTAMDDAGLSASDIDEVIMVGGWTRIPAVQNLVRKLTGGKDPNLTVNPDEVVAMGAAVQAGIVQGDISDVVLVDVTPLSLGVETMGGLMTKLIDRNTTIPAERSEVFSTAADNQPAVDIVVLQGEREMAADNRNLGQFKLDGIRPARRGEAQIEVVFDIDANGILNVSAKDRDTGKEQTITISGSTNLDEGEVDRMLRAAEEHSAKDKQRREETDALNRLDAVIYQLEQQMSLLGDTLPAHHRARSEELLAAGKKAVAERAPLETVRTLTSDVQQMTSALSSGAATAGTGAQAGPGQPDRAAPPGNAGSGGEDVIDAEFKQE
jgi:molecular chaperone DnaK